MHCNNLRLVLGLGLVRVSNRVRVKVRVSVLVRVSIRTSWVVNFALFRCYRPVIYTRPPVTKTKPELLKLTVLPPLWNNHTAMGLLKLRTEHPNPNANSSLNPNPFFDESA